MPSLERLTREYSGGLSVVQVNAGESRRTVSAFMQGKGYSFTVLLDRSGLAGRSYGIMGHPAAVIIDKEGRLVFKTIGYREWYSQSTRELFEALIRE